MKTVRFGDHRLRADGAGVRQCGGALVPSDGDGRAARRSWPSAIANRTLQWFTEHFPVDRAGHGDYAALLANPEVEAVYCRRAAQPAPRDLLRGHRGR